MLSDKDLIIRLLNENYALKDQLQAEKNSQEFWYKRSQELEIKINNLEVKENGQ